MSAKVTFEETGEERIVKRGCVRCFPDGKIDQDFQFVVSPTGIAHMGEDYGITYCGIDATGKKWWWPC
jgi:hypothetical protein